MNAKEMWSDYIDKYKCDKDKSYEAWHFSSNEKNANELAELVVSGEKTATASGLCFYEIENEDLPKVGSLNVILDWNGNARCIIKITKVYTTPFNEVSEEHAFKEGEGDKTLDFWRDVHKKFFTQDLNAHGKDFEESMMVVCEEFELVWKVLRIQ